MRAAGDLRNYSAEARVLVDAGRQGVSEQLTAAHDPHAGPAHRQQAGPVGAAGLAECFAFFQPPGARSADVRRELYLPVMVR